MRCKDVAIGAYPEVHQNGKWIGIILDRILRMESIWETNGKYQGSFRSVCIFTTPSEIAFDTSSQSAEFPFSELPDVRFEAIIFLFQPRLFTSSDCSLVFLGIAHRSRASRVHRRIPKARGPSRRRRRTHQTSCGSSRCWIG